MFHLLSDTYTYLKIKTVEGNMNVKLLALKRNDEFDDKDYLHTHSTNGVISRM